MYQHQEVSQIFMVEGKAILVSCLAHEGDCPFDCSLGHITFNQEKGLMGAAVAWNLLHCDLVWLHTWKRCP